MMGCRTKKLVGSLFKITVGAFGGKSFLFWVPVTVVSVLIYLLLQEAEVII